MITFYYGAMNASKTAQMLMKYHDYKSKGNKPMLIKPATDTRKDRSLIWSRTGLQEKADIIIDSGITFIGLKQAINGMSKHGVIMIDECQFIHPSDIITIVDFAKTFGFDIEVYGLLKDFLNELFNGSKKWLECADNIVEIESQCHIKECKSKATCNLRLDKSGKPVYRGNVVQVDDGESYVSVCSKHYKEK